jgi:hypothetical protein
MTSRTVLVFSTDSLAAALIGAAVELAGYGVAFQNENESPRDAVMRVRPRAALVDCDHEDACTETFFGPALMIGARVAVFSSKRSRRTLEPIAEQFKVQTFQLPFEFDELQALLASLTTAVQA